MYLSNYLKGTSAGMTSAQYWAATVLLRYCVLAQYRLCTGSVKAQYWQTVLGQYRINWAFMHRPSSGFALVKLRHHELARFRSDVHA